MISQVPPHQRAMIPGVRWRSRPPRGWTIGLLALAIFTDRLHWSAQRVSLVNLVFAGAIPLWLYNSLAAVIRAQRFMNDGWSTRKLITLLVTSAALFTGGAMTLIVAVAVFHAGGLASSAAALITGNVITLRGSGSGLGQGGNAGMDGCYFLNQALDGDQQITVRMLSPLCIRSSISRK